MPKKEQEQKSTQYNATSEEEHPKNETVTKNSSVFQEHKTMPSLLNSDMPQKKIFSYIFVLLASNSMTHLVGKTDF